MQGGSRLDSQGSPDSSGNAEKSLLSKTGSPVVTLHGNEFPINYSRAAVEQLALRIIGSHVVKGKTMNALTENPGPTG